MIGVFNLQSAYSMLSNTIPLEILVETAKQEGYDFVALTDTRLHGMMTLFKLAKKHKIKPVLGYQIHVPLDFGSTTFYLYAKNNKGYANLIQIINQTQDEPPTLALLSTYQKDVIFATSGFQSIVDQSILANDVAQAAYYINQFKSLFESFYLGLSLDTFDLEMKVAPALSKLAKEQQIQLLPLHQTSYLNPEDKDIYQALIKIGDDKQEVPAEADYAFFNEKALLSRFSDYPEVFQNSKQLLDSVDFQFDLQTFEMPEFPLEQKVSQVEYLKSLSIMGLKKRLKNRTNIQPKIYQERLLFELNVIHRMGYDNYFLIVYDFVKYAKQQGILVGPGRGSAAGSLVAYCLGITDVDPIQYDLLFERFLNPERMSMPDIDLDFPDNRRDEVIDYVKERYGIKHIASITTFGTFALRSSIRDIARVMKIDLSRVNGIISSVLRNKVDRSDEETVKLLEAASKIEGLPRHTGTHAAGIILAKQDLTKTIPLQKGAYNFYQSQLEAKDLEDLGLLKIDFLGLRNLTVIDQVLHNIKEQGQQVILSELDYQDAKSYALLANADTTGIFQLESAGMRSVLKKLKPDTFEDIVAILALYRPGPMDHIDEYIQRRNGKSFTYLHPLLEPLLKTTYGIIVYQEQIMQIANQFAGYTLAEADLLRRGISKKDHNILVSEEKRFIEKCLTKGYTAELAKEIYALIVRFADYGFNRSHSVAYAIVAYQMAYLKANYFPIFMTVLLSSIIGNESLTQDYLSEAKKQHIEILAPDIQHSTNIYQYESGKILLPLLAIKSIGRNTVAKIIEERQNGLFKNYADFKLRLKKDINERNLEMLIYSGALDGFNLTHGTMLYNKQLDDAGYEQYIKDFKITELPEEGFQTLAAREKEALGFNLKYQPITRYQNVIQALKLDQLTALETKDLIEVIAYVKSSKQIKTKQGKPMVFVTLDDGVTELEATMFTNTFERYHSFLDQNVHIFKLKASMYREQRSYQIEGVRLINKAYGKTT